MCRAKPRLLDPPRERVTIIFGANARHLEGAHVGSSVLIDEHLDVHFQCRAGGHRGRWDLQVRAGTARDHLWRLVAWRMRRGTRAGGDECTGGGQQGKPGKSILEAAGGAAVQFC
ncbi:MAG: hypothetical protein DMD26_14820 [Gemmatimonadetes bacterium]|nr:MAG: hypothetical protein DMD26_14820 [Gemmatimonadota bacterium]